MDHHSELKIGNSVESFHKFVDLQREFFHSRIDELLKIVVTQCKLTDAKPLSRTRDGVFSNFDSVLHFVAKKLEEN
ncbi:hypothetical protein RchiOBHm_Chr2g0170231 [Rosa chinensis]|uniref:Uncharacterized protein n=1 Tax=Rosa chinensis TaxID=74649 RepID=A0A2P6S527_ROSCH|nr:hypothetical protein RchiOBHm_Chr2g0170231 [Rosa chinensis]